MLRTFSVSRQLGALALAFCVACSGRHAAPTVQPAEVAAIVRQEIIERHTRELSSDKYEGRFPGTRGEDLTTQYLEAEMRRIGLRPGNPDGTFVQRLSVLAQRSKAAATLSIDGKPVDLNVPGDALFVLTGRHPTTRLSNSELVFVGYGISAPEFEWDDYANIDVRGKTVLFIRGEPPTFRGNYLTFHGMVERKREVARRHGAAAAILVSPGLPGLRNYAARAGGELISLGTESWPAVSGAFGAPLVERLFAGAGLKVAEAFAAAAQPGFRAKPLPSSLSVEIETSWRDIPTGNVVGLLQGRDPRLRDEVVVFMSHWDAFGNAGPEVNGDRIYNGAVDDAAGVAQMLAAAEALKALRPRRSILFLVTTAEEHSLAGAQYYVDHPLYSLDRTIAAVNFDVIGLAGPTRDVRLPGLGRSTIEEVVRAAAARQGRTVSAEATPDSDLWFNLDSFVFARAGVPVYSPVPGDDVVGQPAGFARERAADYRSRHYHRPSDEVREDWDWGSIVQDAQLGVLVGMALADAPGRPRWLTRVEFGEDK